MKRFVFIVALIVGVVVFAVGVAGADLTTEIEENLTCKSYQLNIEKVGLPDFNEINSPGVVVGGRA